VCGSALQCVAVCGSVLQCAAVRCSAMTHPSPSYALTSAPYRRSTSIICRGGEKRRYGGGKRYGGGGKMIKSFYLFHSRTPSPLHIRPQLDTHIIHAHIHTCTHTCTNSHAYAPPIPAHTTSDAQTNVYTHTKTHAHTHARIIYVYTPVCVHISVWAGYD